MLRAITPQENAMFALYVRFLTLYVRFLTKDPLIKDNAGVTAIEYGLIAALVAVVCITAWKLLGTSLSASFSNVASSV